MDVQNDTGSSTISISTISSYSLKQAQTSHADHGMSCNVSAIPANYCSPSRLQYQRDEFEKLDVKSVPNFFGCNKKTKSNKKFSEEVQELVVLLNQDQMIIFWDKLRESSIFCGVIIRLSMIFHPIKNCSGNIVSNTSTTG